VSTIVGGHQVDLGMLKKRRIRRRWEDGEKIRIVAQTRVPGVSVSQVARRYDVNANLVFKWLRDPRFNPPPEDGLNGSFLPVEVVSAPPVIDLPVIEAPVINTPVIETPVIKPGASGSQVEIVLPTGHRINVSGAYDPDALCRLVRGLAS
jgi:transposase